MSYKASLSQAGQRIASLNSAKYVAGKGLFGGLKSIGKQLTATGGVEEEEDLNVYVKDLSR